jgi:uncharacterized protein YjbI with pentapeptide repeats
MSNNDNSILPPNLPRDIEERAITALHDEDSLSGFLMSGGSFEEVSAEQLSLSRMVLRGVNLSGANLRYFDGADIRFEQCDLSNADLSGAVIHRTVFSDCKLVGTNFTESTLKNITFLNCNGGYANFNTSTLVRIKFESGRFDSASLQDCRLDKLSLIKTSLRSAQLSGSALKDIDFRKCDIEGMGVRPQDLVGAVVTIEQAAFLSRLLGLIIKTPE